MSAVMTMTGSTYSVDVELENGSRTVMQFEAESSSDAYRQARESAGVRRVGRVTQGVRHQHSSPQSSSRQESVARPGDASAHPQAAPERPTSEAHRGQLLGNVISGPRIVRDARLSGGERPFAHLQPPPPRPEPILPPKPKNPPKAVAAPVAPVVAKAAAPAEEAAPAAPAAVDYRIVKSRRKDGLPYLLQRGTWKSQGSKRVFDTGWEKGFETREQAEKHQAWLVEMAAQNAAVAN